MHHYFLRKSYLQCKIIILWFVTSGKVPKKQMGSFTPCQPGYLYIFQTFFCEMTKRQQLKQQKQQNVATQIGQFWTPIMCDWTANFQQIILKHNVKKYYLSWHQECYASTIERDITLGSSIQKFSTMQNGEGSKVGHNLPTDRCKTTAEMVERGDKKPLKFA